MRPHLQAGRVQPRHGVDEIPVPVVTVEQAQAPGVDGLHPQFDQAVLAGLAAEGSQGSGQVGGDRIRAGGEDQADAVRLGEHSGTERQQLFGGQGRGRFLLKIAEKRVEPAPQQQPPAALDLFLERICTTQAEGGEAFRPAEDTAATGAVGAGEAQMERNFAHGAAETLAAVDAEGAQAGRRRGRTCRHNCTRFGRGQGTQGRGDQ